MLVVKAQRRISLVHADVKADNIMLVNQQSEPLKFKLIETGLALYGIQFVEERFHGESYLQVSKGPAARSILG